MYRGAVDHTFWKIFHLPPAGPGIRVQSSPAWFRPTDRASVLVSVHGQGRSSPASSVNLSRRMPRWPSGKVRNPDQQDLYVVEEDDPERWVALVVQLVEERIALLEETLARGQVSG